MNALDLFCGAGGLALGFRRVGFDVTGADISPYCGQTFTFNRIGSFIQADLSHEEITGDYDVIIGGPPCRPWTVLNLKKRRREHEEYLLVNRFFDHIEAIRPEVFVMENVPPLVSDPVFNYNCSRMQNLGYELEYSTISYANFGAPTSRRRLFLIGTRSHNSIFALLEKYRQPPKTVRDAIWHLRNVPRNGVPDHEWLNSKLSPRTLEKCRRGRFGWLILDWDKPAPSFSNVAKAYVLHPDGTRVISVREALLIMGFPEEFRFPPRLGLHTRYQMIADAVSPVFSYALAQAIKSCLMY